MDRFWIKTVNIILIIGMFLVYNMMLDHRAQAEEVARLQAELESSNLQLDEYEKALNQNKTDQEEVAESDYTDGTYQASARGYGGDITIELTIEKGVMMNLNILSAPAEDGAYLQMASSIIKDILKNQSADVDTISGATYSSTGIRAATAKALEQAHK